MFRYTFLAAIIISCRLLGESLAYDCGVMNCNWDNQFCNNEQQRCEDCYGHRHSCFTHMMQANCTTFCRGHELQKLKEKGCQDPPSLMHGYVEETHQLHVYRSKVKVTCLPGYRLLGDTQLTCGDYGQWTQRPICEALTCSAFVNVENGKFVYSEPVNAVRGTLPVNATARLVCGDGHVTHGSLLTKCSENGNWTVTTMPACVKEKDFWSYEGVLTLNGVLVIGLILLFIALIYILKFKKPAPYNDNNKETTKDTEEMEEPLINKDTSSVAIEMTPNESVFHANGVSNESVKLTAEPVCPSETEQSEVEETKVLDSPMSVTLQRQISASDTDVNRVDQTEHMSVPGPSHSEDPIRCSTANERVQNREENSAGGPTFSQTCQRSKASLKSKDSGFDSRVNTGTQIGKMDGVSMSGQSSCNIVVLNIDVNGSNKGPKEEKDSDNPVDEVCADPVQETGETKELEQTNLNGVMETAKGKPRFVIG